MIPALLLLLAQAQPLIDAAPAGSIVHLPPILDYHLVIDKPLTLVGGGAWHLELAGPGFGRVQIINGSSWHVAGDGFTELYLEGWRGQTLQTKALHVAMVRCDFGTVPPGSDGHDGWPDDAPLDAFYADVYLDRTTIAPWDASLPAVYANVLRQTGSTVAGTIHAVHEFGYAQDLTLTGAPRPGSTLTLAWTTPRPLSVLFAQRGSHAAPGRWCLSPGNPVAIGTTTGSFQAAIPTTTNLLGETVAFQVYGLHGYHSRPQLAVIR